MKKIILVVGVMALLGCEKKTPKPQVQPVVSLSISSDGRYVVSAHHGKQLVLWDTRNKTSQVVGHEANIYSAYFIKGMDTFIWQGVKDNTVHVQNVGGNEIKTFNPGFASYGQMFSPELKTYVASDKDWSVHKFFNGNKQKIKTGFNDFYYGKILSMSLVGNTLLTSGTCGYKGDRLPIASGLSASDVNSEIPPKADYSLMNCVVLWDLSTGGASYKLYGNAAKTHATLSPDGKYVVAGDENTLGFVWDAHTGKRLFELDNLVYGKDLGVCEDGVHCRWDDTGLLKPPKDFCFKVDDYHCLYQDPIFAIKFISPTQYLRFTTHVYYTILYDVLDPQPKKYLKLEGFPDVNGYTEAARTDTAPEAGILVMGAAAKSGIRVYQYDKENETLQLVWAPDDFDRTKLADNPKT